MYLARFSYDVAPRNRQRALDTIRREVEAARNSGLDARILIPLTRRDSRVSPARRGLERRDQQLDARL